MKRILLAASALSLLAAPAFAQNNSAVTFNGTVGSACVVPSVNQTFDISANLVLDANGFLAAAAPGSFADLVDLGALTSGTDAWCNTATTVAVAGTSLVNAAAGGVNGIYGGIAGGDFTATIPMNLEGLSIGGAHGVSWPTHGDLSTGGGLDGGQIQSETSASAFAGPVEGVLQIWSPTLRPVAGSYTSTWTVTVTPNS